MPTRNNLPESKVFGHIEGQNNRDSFDNNKKWDKIGKAQRTSEDKMRNYQFDERARQRSGERKQEGYINSERKRQSK